MATRGLEEKVTMTCGQYHGRDEILGWTSLFFWAIGVVVTLEYIVLIMRADNQGEGGLFGRESLIVTEKSGMSLPRKMR